MAGTMLLSAVLLLAAAAPVCAQTHGVPLRERYAALLEKARRGQLREDAPEPARVQPGLRVFRGPGGVTQSEVFGGEYREAAKTSFADAPVESLASLDAVFNPLPSDAGMEKDFPKLKPAGGVNAAPRIALEKRNVKVRAWIYWVVPEDDHDFHVILGSTPEWTTATVFMNSEVSGVPAANPTKSPFPQRRKDLRAIRASHPNVDGLFNPPVPVFVTGSLLWDGEHTGRKRVGTDGLKSTKAWEIHPIKELKVRKP